MHCPGEKDWLHFRSRPNGSREQPEEKEVANCEQVLRRQEIESVNAGADLEEACLELSTYVTGVWGLNPQMSPGEASGLVKPRNMNNMEIQCQAMNS